MVKIKQKSVSKEPDYLELGVVPQSNFLQRLARLFRKEKKEFSIFDYYNSFECRLKGYRHRLELIRTIGTCINVTATICVLLKIFKVI